MKKIFKSLKIKRLCQTVNISLRKFEVKPLPSNSEIKKHGFRLQNLFINLQLQCSSALS